MYQKFSLISTLFCLYVSLIHTSIAGDVDSFHYRYVSLDATVPAGCQFFNPLAISNAGWVYGTTDCGGDASVIRYKNGISTVLGKGPTFAIAANSHGVVGGSVIDAQGVLHAAIFAGGGTKLLPSQPHEIGSLVLGISDSGIALVSSTQATSGDPVTVYYLYRHGFTKRLDFPATDNFDPIGLNDFGVVAGIVNGGKAFRFNPWLKKLTILDPLPSEPFAWGLDIHNNGDVLGYSFVINALERIGVWRGFAFSTYFVEGTPKFPTVSNRVLWNSRNLIVVTDVLRPVADLGGFIIPRPGKRLALAELVPGLHAWTQIFDVNDDADLVGWGGPAQNEIAESFLLERVHELHGNSSAAAAASTAPTSARAPTALHSPADRRVLSVKHVAAAARGPR